MRNVTLRLLAALVLIGSVSVAASAAPVPNAVDTGRGQHTGIVQASYYWHHHHYDHRRWQRDHWRYY
jgi:hypothetical protein